VRHELVAQAGDHSVVGEHRGHIGESAPLTEPLA
jgi:hypothetical protein